LNNKGIVVALQSTPNKEWMIAKRNL